MPICIGIFSFGLCIVPSNYPTESFQWILIHLKATIKKNNGCVTLSLPYAPHFHNTITEAPWNPACSTCIAMWLCGHDKTGTNLCLVAMWSKMGWKVHHCDPPGHEPLMRCVPQTIIAHHVQSFYTCSSLWLALKAVKKEPVDGKSWVQFPIIILQEDSRDSPLVLSFHYL